MSFLGDLLVRLKLDSADFQQDMGKAANATEKAFNQIKSAAKTLGAALAVDELVEMFKHTMEVQDQLGELSKVIGTSVEKLDQMRQVSQLTGTNFDSVTLAMTRLSRMMSTSGVETTTAAGAFKFLGISVKDSSGNFKNASDLMQEIAVKLGQYQDGAGKVALVQDLLGKNSAALIPYLKQLAEGTERTTGVTRESAEQAHKFEVALRELGIQAEQTKIQFANGLVVTLTNFLTQLNELKAAGGWMGFLTTTNAEAEDPAAAVTKYSQKLAEMEKQRDAIAAMPMWKRILEADDVAILNKQIDATTKKLEMFKKLNLIQLPRRVAEMAPTGSFDMDGMPKALNYNRGDPAAAAAEAKLYTSALQNLENQLGKVTGRNEEQKVKYELVYGSLRKLTPEHGAYLLQIAKEIDKRKSTIEQIGAEYDARIILFDIQKKEADLIAQRDSAFQRQKSDMQFQIDMLGKTQRQQEQLTAAREIDLAATERINQRTAALVDDETGERSMAIFEEETKAAERQKKVVFELMKQRQDAERSWAVGTKDAFNVYIENATNAAAQANMLFTNAFRSMEDALVNFVKTGKLDFKSLADSIISDLIRIQVRAAMAQIFGNSGVQGAAGGMGGGMGGIMSLLGSGGGGLTDKISGLFQDNSPVVDSFGDALPDLGSLFAVSGFADGGRPPIGEPSLVGEEGPELFVPDTAGKIVPNSAFGNGGGDVYIDARGADAGRIAMLENTVRAMGRGFNRTSVAAQLDAARRGVTV